MHRVMAVAALFIASSGMMGPYATMILGDYGADVIKVESPDGDVMRHAAPMRNPRMARPG